MPDHKPYLCRDTHPGMNHTAWTLAIEEEINSKSQGTEPEIHLHGDIIVNLPENHNAKAQVNMIERDMEQLSDLSERAMITANIGKSPAQGSSRTTLPDVHAALSEAIGRLSDRLDRLDHRTHTIRNNMASPTTPFDGLCDDSASETIQAFSSLWAQLVTQTNRLDWLIDQMEI